MSGPLTTRTTPSSATGPLARPSAALEPAAPAEVAPQALASRDASQVVGALREVQAPAEPVLAALPPALAAPYKAAGTPIDPQHLKPEDLNRFNAIQQVMASVLSAGQAAALGVEHDVSSQAQAAAKTQAPPKKKKGFFGKLCGWIKKALPIVSTIAMFVPGLNVIALSVKLATLAMKAAEVVKAVKSGNWQALAGSIGSIAGSFAGADGVLGEICQWGSTGTGVALGVKNGGLAGGLGSLGGLIGGELGRDLSTAGKAIQAVKDKDVAALAQLGVDGASAAKILDEAHYGEVSAAIEAADAAARGRLDKALARAGDVLGPDPHAVQQAAGIYERGELAQLARHVAQAGGTLDGLRAGLQAGAQATQTLKTLDRALDSGDYVAATHLIGSPLGKDGVAEIEHLLKRTLADADD